ncbi:MAG TPA: M1 family peptidase, partial [Polyangiaceae bacterium]|nr:M1 family peptidase [Polyangiaceae bacterium]
MTSDPEFDRRAPHPSSSKAISGARLWLELAAGFGLAGFGIWLGLAHLQPPTRHSSNSLGAAGTLTNVGTPAEAAAPNTAKASAMASGAATELSRVPAVASYTMQAKLNPTTHVVKGTQRIVWTNTSRAAVSSLYFHLYLNAFKNEQSLFLRSPFNASRGAVRAQEFGYIDVKSMVAQEWPGQDLWLSRAAHSPGDPLDETDIEVPLPSPVAPGSPVTLDVTFEARLPSVVERTGYSGRFHFVAQWFPKIARLESDGSFAHFAFHPQSEFYADFGRYDVTLEVPEAFRLGATGRRIEQQVVTGTRRERYVAEAV